MNLHLPRTTVLVLAASIAASIATAGCTGPEASSARSAAHSATPAAAVATASVPDATRTGVIRGLPSLPDYPVEVDPDPAWDRGESGNGALSFIAPDAGGKRVIAVHGIGELANTPEADLPADVAGFLAAERTDVDVSGVRTVTHSGLPAQRFRLTIREGRTPQDLWRVLAGERYKPLRTSPMEVVSVRSSRGLVWLWTEFAPEDEASALARFDSALARVTVR